MSEQNPDRGLVLRAGPITVDVPRSLGYYGGIAVAVGVGMIEPPLALFIGAIPVVKMLMRGGAPQPLRFLGQVFDGAAQPVGGDAQGTIRVRDDGSSSGGSSSGAPSSRARKSGTDAARETAGTAKAAGPKAARGTTAAAKSAARKAAARKAPSPAVSSGR